MGAKRKKKRSRAQGFIDALLEWAETLVFGVFLVIVCFTFIFRIARVHGRSMEGTLFENDRLIISHLFYSPKNGDIVVIKSDKLDDIIIKRVIAVSNQEVEIDYAEGSVRVDGELLDESYIDPEGMKRLDSFDEDYYDAESGTYRYKVPFGYVFVLGDNRAHSTDSRMFGFVSDDDIVGRVLLRIYSEKAGLGTVK